MKGRIGDGLEFTREALQIFENEYSLWDSAYVMIALGTTLPHLGNIAEGLANLFRAVAIFRELGDSRWLMEGLNYAGMVLGVFLGLKEEGLNLVHDAIRINNDTKIGDYLRLSQSFLIESWINSFANRYKEALINNLEAVNYAEKTDSFWVQGAAYASLSTLYAGMGEGKLAEAYYEKLMKLPAEVQYNTMVNAPLAKACYFAYKNQWEQSDKIFNELFLRLQADSNPALEGLMKASYAGILRMQGRFEEAKRNWQQSEQIRNNLNRGLEHTNLFAYLVAPRKVKRGESFEIRLDIINISKENASLTSIKNLLLSGIEVTSLSKQFVIHEEVIKPVENILQAFGIMTLKLLIKPPSGNILNLSPVIDYVSDTGQAMTSKPRPLKVIIASDFSTEEVRSTKPPKIEFTSEFSKKIFDFLLKIGAVCWNSGGGRFSEREREEENPTQLLRSV